MSFLSLGRIFRAMPRAVSSATKLRHFATYQTMRVFDRDLKRVQRSRAASAEDSKQFDYLRNEVARRLTERMEDITRKFPVCADLGSHSGHIAKFLGDRGGVETLIQLDMCEKSLTRDMKEYSDTKYGEHATGGVEKMMNAIPPSRKMYFGAADEEYLPLKNDSVDLIISNLSLHWTNDLPGALAQCHNALKPDGAFIAAMLGGETLQELRSAFAMADMERIGGVKPHISPFTSIRDVGDLMSSAGFSLPTVDHDTITIPFPDMFTLVEHLQGMGEANAPFEKSGAVSRDVFLAAASAYDAMYADEDGLIPATFQVIYMIGWKPHQSQQQPDERGTASKQLTEVQLDKLFPPPGTSSRSD